MENLKITEEQEILLLEELKVVKSWNGGKFEPDDSYYRDYATLKTIISLTNKKIDDKGNQQTDDVKNQTSFASQYFLHFIVLAYLIVWGLILHLIFKP